MTAAEPLSKERKQPAPAPAPHARVELNSRLVSYTIGFRSCLLPLAIVSAPTSEQLVVKRVWQLKITVCVRRDTSVRLLRCYTTRGSKSSPSFR